MEPYWYTGSNPVSRKLRGSGGDCEGEPCPSSIIFVRHGEKEIKTDADARKAAVNFSRYVS